MTYSIVAKDPETGDFAVAVASRFFAVGMLVPHLRGGACAVATQAFISPLWGIEAADRLALGEDPGVVIADLVARDGGQAIRQIHMIDAEGRIGQHTGADCVDWSGHVSSPGVSVAGNMLAAGAVIQATLAAYQAHMHLPLAERLMTAMEAGAAAGGDKRGTQSAALVINKGEAYPWLDLRADDHPDPLAELRRLYDVAHERFVYVAAAMPTRDNFSGVTERGGIDTAIRAADTARKAAGVSSRSFATDLEV